ncbi:MAG: hypothetical protein JJU45_14890 [Acidimicrobiia bacterium]|nr:hypothetical protein [Acidimicrobiia bacterium]
MVLTIEDALDLVHEKGPSLRPVFDEAREKVSDVAGSVRPTISGPSRPTIGDAVDLVRSDPRARLAVVFVAAFAFSAGFVMGTVLAQAAGDDEPADAADR